MNFPKNIDIFSILLYDIKVIKLNVSKKGAKNEKGVSSNINNINYTLYDIMYNKRVC